MQENKELNHCGYPHKLIQHLGMLFIMLKQIHWCLAFLRFEHWYRGGYNFNMHEIVMAQNQLCAYGFNINYTCISK